MIKDLKKLKWHFIILSLFFIVCIIIGYNMRLPVDSLDTLASNINPISVFSNNFRASLLLIIGGLISFGVITITYLILNGITIGNVIYIDSAHNGLLHTFFLIVPHGIFEIPAIIISSLVGVQVAIIVIDALRKETKSSKVYIRRIIMLFIISTMLLFIGSIVESYITPIFI